MYLNLHKDITKLEKVQRQATKYILNKNSIDYKTRLLQTYILRLMYWFELQDILFAIKCFKDPSENCDIKNYLFDQTVHGPTPHRNSSSSMSEKM